jgi:hypothetical protein
MTKGIVNKKKGDLLENVVAKLPFKTGWVVEKRKKLPVLNSRIKRSREIDVLYSMEVGGNRIRYAVSCKNEKDPVGVKDIGDFLTALNEVGIPPANALFVSVKGFTKDAKDCAYTNSLQICTYSGLNRTRDAEQIAPAFFRQTYYLINAFTLNVLPYVPGSASDEPSHIKLDIADSEEVKQRLLHEVWKRWIGGKVPMKIGEQILHFKPKDSAPTWHAIADLKIEAHYFVKSGTFTHGLLQDQETTEMVAGRFDATFEETGESIELRKLESEQEFNGKAATGQLHISSKVRVPRILTHDFGFFPPTVEEAERAKFNFESGLPFFDSTKPVKISDAWKTK